MTDDEIVLDFIGRLERLSIPYMIVGSFASSVWGRPRATHDTDVVVVAEGPTARSLREALHPDYYVPGQGFEDAVRRRKMVNAIHQKPIWKIDIIFHSDGAFQKRQFQRRVAILFKGSTLHVASPEDTILAKLEWSLQGESERQYRDALGVFEVQKGSLDIAYLREWAESLAVGELLKQIEADAV
jgi:hypothetical protein